MRCLREFEPGEQILRRDNPPDTSNPGAPLSSYDSDSWEPRTEEKGLIARSMFYMATRYDGSDTPNAATYRFGILSTLLA